MGGEDRTGAGDRPGLILGHLDGTHRILVEMGTSARWDGQPVVSTSRQGVALVVVQRGAAWGLHSIDVDRGEATQLVEVDDDLWDAAIDPDATAAYWFVGGDGPTGGVWRIDLATKEITHVLEADPVARAGGNVLAAHVRPLGQLAVGDGMLAALECYHDCRLRLVDLGSGTFRDFSAPAYTGQELMGFVPGGLAFWGGCLLLPDGEVTHQRCPDPDGAEAALESEGAMGFHVVLPSGWRLEVEPVPEAPVMSFEMSALAVSSETGERIPLRVLGTLHGQ